MKILVLGFNSSTNSKKSIQNKQKFNFNVGKKSTVDEKNITNSINIDKPHVSYIITKDQN
jgi:hypothetical protein